MPEMRCLGCGVMTRGRPFQPGNKFGRGRPKGSPNKESLKADQIFLANQPAIMALAIKRSFDDPQMLRMLASRIVPPRRELPTKLGRLPLETLEDLDRTSHTVLQMATSGKITLSEAGEFNDMLDRRRQLLMARDMERRISSLENPTRQPD
jgi:hypothetical protein